MNALYVICGIGTLALLAEVLNVKKWIGYIAFAGLLVAAGYIVMDWNMVSYRFHGMVYFDRVTMAFSGLIVVATLAWMGIARSYFNADEHKADKSALVLFALAGALLMVAFNNLAILFLGIEILSISLYVLAGSNKQSLFSTEASFKYFLMGSFATGFLLFGIALVYGAVGSFNLGVIAQTVSSMTSMPRYLIVGMLLMMVGLAFKISAVPFHFWAPDVYEGSPTPVTAFMSTVVKIAAFVAFAKVFASVFGRASWILQPVEQGLMVLTLVVANVAAVYQSNVKRMLAFSSVGQVGYLLLAFSSEPVQSMSTIFFYLMAYCTASLLAFTVVNLVESKRGSASVDNFAGLFKSNPLLAVGLTIALFSLAGIPPLAGFFGKYLVFSLAISHGVIVFTVVAVLTSLIGVYYYFRPVIAMTRTANDSSPLSIDLRERVLLVLLIVANLLIGIFPEFFQFA